VVTTQTHAGAKALAGKGVKVFLIWISDLVDTMGWRPKHVEEMQFEVVMAYMKRPKYWEHVRNRAKFNLSL
jgi:hypothetical protein